MVLFVHNLKASMGDTFITSPKPHKDKQTFIPFIKPGTTEPWVVQKIYKNAKTHGQAHWLKTVAQNSVVAAWHKVT